MVVQVSHDVGTASIRLEHVDDEDDRAPATVIVAQEHLIRLTHAPASTPARRSEGVADAAMETHSTRTGIVTTHFRPVTASASKRRRLVALEGDNDVELDNAVNTELASFYHKQRQQIGGTKSSSSSSSDEEHVPVISTEMTRASAGVGLASALGLSPSPQLLATRLPSCRWRALFRPPEMARVWMMTWPHLPRTVLLERTR